MNKTFKSLLSIVLSVLMLLSVVAFGANVAEIDSEAATNYIDNSSLVTPWVPDSQVELDEKGWPTYIKDLIIVECRVERASADGTFLGMEKTLKHLAETGVNGLWVTPIADHGLETASSTYTNYGVHTVDPYLTGQIALGEAYDETKVDYEAGRQVVKQFVDMCHKYNIRVFFDMVVWGVSKVAPIFVEEPDFFTGDTTWGGYEFDHSNVKWQDYYYDSLKEFVMETGCDGLRMDLEPTVLGYEFYELLHEDLLSQGRKPVIISEAANFRGTAYAIEQHGGVSGVNVNAELRDDVFFNQVDIVKAVQTGENVGDKDMQANGEGGKSRYYTFQLSSHDILGGYVKPTDASWGYQFLYGSFIPLFYMGEEWAHECSSSLFGAKELYNFEEHLKDPEKRAYFEMVKELISYKWIYKDIVNKSFENHRDTNICSVMLKGSDYVNGYARYADNKAFVVVPNINQEAKTVEMTIGLKLADMDLDNYKKYTVTNVRTGEVIAQGNSKVISVFKDKVEHNTVGLYLVTAENQFDRPVSNKNDTTLETDDEVEDTEPKKETVLVKKPKKKNNKTDEGVNIWLIIAIIAGAAVVIGGGTATLVIVKKRKKV